ncbi:MAG: glycosyltransferase [Oscillospiraceae bacterium]|jgi:glycosyltransferase involved in cell wall biosynthesis|nr:glycosyltransferase [Oscillospiraceae bacterium]
MANTKKAKPRNSSPAKKGAAGRSAVRLSQCMIVKNEEKNIERALTWAKGIAFEQIVVDTGSTDRTVEIAKSLGATVYHFDWIEDFSAAKNYAIEQAKGNWIAFCDADEYLPDADAKKLKGFLQRTAAEFPRALVVRCDWANLDGEGNIFLTLQQDRFFRNHPGVRYVNRIHEFLSTPWLECMIETKEISIIHTGYTSAALMEQSKAERNMKIIREEMAERPEDTGLKRYLADALVVLGTEDALAEAETLYRDVVEDETVRTGQHGRAAIDYLIRTELDRGRLESALEICARAREYHPENQDFYYYSAKALFALRRFDEAWDMFVSCENAILSGKSTSTRMNADSAEAIMQDMMRCALERDDWQKAVEYALMTLTQNKYASVVLHVLLVILRSAVREDDMAILNSLRRIYDFDDPHDKLFLAKCAKAAKDEVLMIFFYKMITDKDRAILNPTMLNHNGLAK